VERHDRGLKGRAAATEFVEENHKKNLSQCSRTTGRDLNPGTRNLSRCSNRTQR
jgi:hypothetical protein